jgi:superfamily II DNA helicase RecQ
MQYRLFQYPLPAPDEPEDLNHFLATNRIVVVTHHVVPNPAGAMLLFVVEYIAGAAKTEGGRSPRIDYREVLSDSDFAVFSRLRDERKKIAEEKGMPLYAIFSNAQLAEMVTRRVRTEADLREVEGIGRAKVEEYAARFLPLLVEGDTSTPPAGDSA